MKTFFFFFLNCYLVKEYKRIASENHDKSSLDIYVYLCIHMCLLQHIISINQLFSLISKGNTSNALNVDVVTSNCPK